MIHVPMDKFLESPVFYYSLCFLCGKSSWFQGVGMSCDAHEWVCAHVVSFLGAPSGARTKFCTLFPILMVHFLGDRAVI